MSIDSLSAAEGMLYAGGESSGNTVAGIDAASGKVEWLFTLTGGGSGAMNVTPTYADGLLFFGGQRDDKLYAVEAKTGKLVAEWPGVGSMYTRHPVVSDRTLYYMTQQSLVARDLATRNVKWSFQFGFAPQTSPAVERKYVVLLWQRPKGSNVPDVVLAIDKETGRPAWRQPFPYMPINHPLVYRGLVYAASGSQVAAFDIRDGTSRWRTKLPAADQQTHLAYGYGLLAAVWKDAGGKGAVFALGATSGDILWQFSTGGEGVRGPAATPGAVYVTGWENPKIFALDRMSGAVLWSADLPRQPTGDPIVAYGLLYIPMGDVIFVYGS
jgi:outer membrane protein assembly factor BamB